MANIKPTFKEPISPQSKEFEKDFKKTMVANNLNVQESHEKLNEIDGMLSEAEQSLKKKIFSLPKMEALVFSDPKLSAVYEEMAENGEEKYGYHYNETIQNMIFNDYVLNSPTYLQKYKMAIPKEKKRRDKSGINQLKKAGMKKMDATGTKLNTNTPKDVDESTTAGSAGGSAGYTGFAGPAAWSTKGDLMGDGKKKGQPLRKPIWNGGTIIQESEYLTDPTAFEKYIELLNEETDADFISHYGGNTYGSVNNMNPENQKIIKNDIQSGKLDRNNIKNAVALQEKAVSQNQQQLMGMAYAYKNGKLKGEPSDEVIRLANSMSEKDLKDFASTKHKGLPEKVNEELYDKINKIEYFNKLGQLMNSDGEINPEDLSNLSDKPIKLTFTDGSEERVSYDEYKQVYMNNYDIKEDTQTMIQNNGTSMSNKAQPTGDQGSSVPVGTQMTSGLNESDIKLLEEINKELEAFSIHHDKLKIMSEERKSNSQILNARVGDENVKNFKNDFKNSDTKKVIDVEKELEYKDQQTNIKDPQKLGMDIEKQAIKNSNMTGDEALKNVGNSTNDNGDEIPKRNLTTDEQEEVNLYRNGQHSIVYDNEPDERFVERQKADQGKFFDIGEKQKEFKSDAPLYNKDNTFVEDAKDDKVQFDKNVKRKGDTTAWNERMGLGSNVKLSESMITGRYNDILGKRRLIEFKIGDVQEFADKNGDGFAIEHLFEMDFTGLGNKYLSKTIDKKVVVNENIANTLENDKFYTDGKNVFVVQAKPKNLNESLNNEEKPIINEEINKMKHLLGYKPNSFVDTKNVKINRGF